MTATFDVARYVQHIRKEVVDLITQIEHVADPVQRATLEQHRFRIESALNFIEPYTRDRITSDLLIFVELFQAVYSHDTDDDADEQRAAFWHRVHIRRVTEQRFDLYDPLYKELYHIYVTQLEQLEE